MDLHIVWFLLLAILLMGYAILDGFDLGVGILHLLVRDDTERRLVLNSIGPLWDGNEVWLVTFGGALFAAFPEAYATVLSGFYLPVIVVLLSLIGRAISIEFRSKSHSRLWRAYWDFSFFSSSLFATGVFGLALGNVVGGIPLTEGRYAGGLLDLVRPFPVAVGLLAITGAAMHGALYLQLKVEGDLLRRVRRWAWVSFVLFVALNLVVAGLAFTGVPHLLTNFGRWPVLWVMPGLVTLALANIPRGLARGMPGQAFASSCASIAGLTFLAAAALFPNLVVSSTDPSASLDIYRAASSESTLGLMGIIALIGMPLVAGYTATVYWVFRGKTTLDEHSY